MPVAAGDEDEERLGGVGVVPVVEGAVLVEDCCVGCGDGWHGCFG